MNSIITRTLSNIFEDADVRNAGVVWHSVCCEAADGNQVRSAPWARPAEPPHTGQYWRF